MRTHPFAKALVAVASILALFALSATPASAGGPYPFTITGGTFTAFFDTFNLPSTGTGGPCTPKANTTAISASGTAPAGGWTIGGVHSTQFQLGTPPSGQWYQADITLAGTGTWSGSFLSYTLTTTAPNHLTFQARIYRVPSCAKTDLACIITGRLAGTGSFWGHLPDATTIDSFTLNVSTANPGGLSMTATSCSAPFSSWHGMTASIWFLDGHLDEP